MNNKKLTAVEWFALELYEKFEMKGNGNIYNELLEKAKELEKQQICESFANGYLDFENTGRAMEVAEQYHKETYEQ